MIDAHRSGRIRGTLSSSTSLAAALLEALVTHRHARAMKTRSGEADSSGIGLKPAKSRGVRGTLAPNHPRVSNGVNPWKHSLVAIPCPCLSAGFNWHGPTTSRSAKVKSSITSADTLRPGATRTATLTSGTRSARTLERISASGLRSRVPQRPGVRVVSPRRSCPDVGCAAVGGIR